MPRNRRKAYVPVGMATNLMPLRKAGYRGVDLVGVNTVLHTTSDRMDQVKEDAVGDYVRADHELARRIVGEEG